MLFFFLEEAGRDKALFAQCVNDFSDAVDNQRYLLIKSQTLRGLNDFMSFRNVFLSARRTRSFSLKHEAVYGAYDVVYTRNEKGRAILLEGKIKALANREERCIRRKKMNG